MKFGAAKTNLGDWMGVNLTRFPLTVRAEIINAVRVELVRELDLRFGEKTDTLSALAAVPTIALPSRFSNPFSLFYLDATGARKTIGFMRKDEFDESFPDPSKTAEPSNYTIWGSSIYLGKTPIQNRSLTFNYYGLPADLADDEDEDGLMLNCWDAIRWGALAWTARYLIEDDRLPVWDTNYLQAKNDLAIEHARARSAGAPAQAVEPH